MRKESALYIRQEDKDSALIVDLTDNVDPQGVQLTLGTRLEVHIHRVYKQPGKYSLEVVLNRDNIFPRWRLPGDGFTVNWNDPHYVDWKKRPVELAVKIFRKFGSIKLILEPKEKAVYVFETGIYTGRKPFEYWDKYAALFQLTAETHFDGMKIRHVIWEEPDSLWREEISFPQISRAARIADKYPAEAYKMRQRQRKMKRED